MLRGRLVLLGIVVLAVSWPAGLTHAAGPALVDSELAVETLVSGLSQPTTLAFIAPDDLLVLEKATGQVKRVTGGAVQGTVLDLAVNSASERGLLGIALHPDFPTTPSVYLFWTESTTGADTTDFSATGLLGNRIDRFTWDGSFLTFDRNIARLRAIQSDADQPARGNHNGGVLAFGPDGKLYAFVGDVGRRGWLQNLPCGPTDSYDCPPGTPVDDDAFGGPEPDDAHLTGVVLRLNDDGTAPTDNPFYATGAAMGGEVGANVQLIYSYGHRNSFGMAFDPGAGTLWLQENGDDSFSEINRVTAGMNSGWIQLMGPSGRVDEYKAIETSTEYHGLHQLRWPPENIADSESEAFDRLFMLPGSHYADPQLSWKYEVSPGGLGFISGPGLGSAYDGDLIVGGARDMLAEGHLFRLKLSADGSSLVFSDPALSDRVADNTDKWDVSESESLMFGSGFGVVTDIETGPDGRLYLASLSHGTIYVIERVEAPPTESPSPTVSPTDSPLSSAPPTTSAGPSTPPTASTSPTAATSPSASPTATASAGPTATASAAPTSTLPDTAAPPGAGRSAGGGGLLVVLLLATLFGAVLLLVRPPLRPWLRR